MNYDIFKFGNYTIKDDKLTGELNKIEDFTGFSNNPLECSGYYICLNLEPWEGVKFGFDDVTEETAKSTKDDGIIICRICGTDKANPRKKLKIFRNKGFTTLDVSKVTLKD